MSAELDLLRGALELAVVVARDGRKLTPPVSGPTSLNRYISFRHLPQAALVPVRRAVDDDDAFRGLVAKVATDELVGEAGLLWLRRPEGWEDALAALVAEHDAVEAEERAGAEEQAATRRVAGLEEAKRRLDEQLAEARRERDELQARHDKVVGEAQRLRQQVDELERGLARARRRQDEAVARADEAEEKAVQAAEAARASDHERQRLEREMAAAPTWSGPPAAGRSEPRADIVAVSLPSGAVDALRDAAGALGGLADALSRAVSALVPAEAVALDPARRGGIAAPVRRLPLRLPRGLRETTVEGAAWLVGDAGAHVIVDGYNVAKLGWPDLDLADQRERLLDALHELACRTRGRPEVIFDGADVGPVAAGRSRALTVRFSAPGESADDVIRREVAHLPAAQPVVVVTNDRAIVDDVRARGANVVSSERLLAVARR